MRGANKRRHKRVSAMVYGEGDRIFVRAKGADGHWQSVAISTLPAEVQEQWIKRWCDDERLTIRSSTRVGKGT